MSQHASLKGSGKITSKRNVLKRFERVNLLQKRGEWKEGSRGLAGTLKRCMLAHFLLFPFNESVLYHFAAGVSTGGRKRL